MFSTTIDASVLDKRFSALEQKQLPFATANAVNDGLFAARQAWQQGIASVFDSPTQLTLNAVLYRKATKENLEGQLFLRNEATKGTPPSRYLVSQVRPGPRAEKPFEYLLRAAGVLGNNEFVTPARGFSLDPHGNIPGGILTLILSDLQASRNVDARSTAETRAKRSRRKKANKRGVYFYNRAKRGNLPRGIYERTSFGAAGNAVRLVLAIVEGPPVYRQRFDAFGIANAAFTKTFAQAFPRRLAEALSTARI